MRRRLTAPAKRLEAITFTAFCATLGVVFEAAQEVLFRVMFDGVEPSFFAGPAFETAQLLFGDIVNVPALARDVAVIVKGARVGGTRFSSLRCGHLGVTVDLSGLAPGELAYVLYVGPDVRLSRQALRYWAGEVERHPRLRERVVGEMTKDGFTMRRDDGRLVRYEVLPATRGGSALRARTLVAVHFTEFAFVRDEGFTVNDVELFQAVRPRVVRGGQVIIESTPWIEAGVLFQLDRDNFGDPKNALVAHAPTIVMRDDPRVRAMVEAEQLRDPDNAAREYGGLYLEAGAQEFFDGVGIKASIDRERPPVTYAAEKSTPRGAGADLALERNSSTLAIVERVGDFYRLLEIVERRPERGKPLSLGADVLRGTFAPVLQRHDIEYFTADQHVREPAREFCIGITIAIDGKDRPLEIVDAPEGAKGKVESYTLLQTLIREGRFKMAPNARLENQLRAVVGRPLPGGGVRIVSPQRPDGSHGDLVSALVNAVWAASLAEQRGRARHHVLDERSDCVDAWGDRVRAGSRLGSGRGFG